MLKEAIYMKKICSLLVVLVLLLNSLAGCVDLTQKESGRSNENETKNLLDGILFNEVISKDDKIKKMIFSIGDATVYVLVDNYLPILPISFELTETKVNVSAVCGTLSDYPEDESEKGEKRKSQKSFELVASDILYYDAHKTNLDLVKMTFIDGENIIGCALFTVACGEELSYSLKKAVEFPKVDGKYQDITAEQVEAVFATVEDIGTLALPAFPENVIANEAEINRSDMFANEVKLCGVTVTGGTWSLASSALRGAPLKFTGVDKKVTVESANNNFLTYISVGNGTWNVNESKTSFELSTDAVLHYSPIKPEKENFIDFVVVTVYDGDDIVGCAVFSVFVNNLNFYYVVEGAVEFPKVDGKNQSITSEIVKAYAESALK